MRPIVYPVTATDVANGFTVPLPVDYNRVSGQYGIQYLASGGGAGTGTMQVTLDNPFTPPAGGLTWSTVALVAGRAAISQAALAFRVLTPVAGDIITIVAQGASAAG